MLTGNKTDKQKPDCEEIANEKLSNNSQQLSRADRLATLQIKKEWDLIIVGGGICGAGILKLASQLGLDALLLEQKDFAWGSSSRSSKMVHGGLRYMAEGDFKLTRESVSERQSLLNGSQGLVKSQSFAMAHFPKRFPGPKLFNFCLTLYDYFCGEKKHRFWSKKDFQYLIPGSNEEDSLGGTQFCDAMTDDARLVLRLLQESMQLGNCAVNYAKVVGWLYQNQNENQNQNPKQRIRGVKIQCSETQQSFTASAKLVINASGAWSAQLLDKLKSNCANDLPKIRPLRGSHLVIASWRLPVATAISVLHPIDNRPVQIYPWQNVTLVGTTDVEHGDNLSFEPRISLQEFDYLMACIDYQFPKANISRADIISTFAGVRPVIAGNSLVDPSREKRQHSLHQVPGMISIAGGKLTTFQLIARQVLKLAAKDLDLKIDLIDSFKDKIFDELVIESPDARQQFTNSSDGKNTKARPLECYQIERLGSRYGNSTQKLLRQISQKWHRPIAYSSYLWSELIWALRFEQVVHLDDLLLRRTRIGNVLTQGAQDEMETIKCLCQKYLGWGDNQWKVELKRYQTIWKNCYSLPQK